MELEVEAVGEPGPGSEQSSLNVAPAVRDLVVAVGDALDSGAEETAAARAAVEDAVRRRDSATAIRCGLVGKAAPR